MAQEFPSALDYLFAGQDQGNKLNKDALANLKSEWDLQRSYEDDPLKSISNRYNANLDYARDTPENIGWKVAGETGDSMSKYSKGKIEFDTLDPTIKNKLTELENQGIDLESLGIFKRERNKNIKAIQDGTGVIGFPTQEQEQPTGNIGFNFEQQPGDVTNFPQGTAEPTGGQGFFRNALKPAGIVGPLKNEAAMKASMGTDYRTGSVPYNLDQIDQEIKRFGDKDGSLAIERARIVQELQAGGNLTPIPQTGGAPVFSNMQTQAAQSAAQPTSNRWSGLIPNTGKQAQMAGIMALDPDLVKDFSKTEMNNEAKLAAAEARARQAESGIDARNDKNDRTALSTDYRTNETAIARQADELRKYLSGAVAQENFEKLVEGKNYSPEARAKLKSQVDADVNREVARIKTDITNLRSINEHILKKMYPNYGTQSTTSTQVPETQSAPAGTGVTPGGNTYRKVQTK